MQLQFVIRHIHKVPPHKILNVFYTHSKWWNSILRTGVYPHMPIAVAASLSHMVRDCPASLSHLANDCSMHYWFFTFWPWGLTPGPKFCMLHCCVGQCWEADALDCSHEDILRTRELGQGLVRIYLVNRFSCDLMHFESISVGLDFSC